MTTTTEQKSSFFEYQDTLFSIQSCLNHLETHALIQKTFQEWSELLPRFAEDCQIQIFPGDGDAWTLCGTIFVLDVSLVVL